MDWSLTPELWRAFLPVKITPISSFPVFIASDIHKVFQLLDHLPDLFFVRGSFILNSESDAHWSSAFFNEKPVIK